MGSHVVKMLRCGNLRGKLPQQIDAVRFYKLDKPVQLIGSDKRIDGVTEQNQVRLFQRGAGRCKILFIAFDALPYGQLRYSMFGMKFLQIQRRM